jgi:DNA uptake protein ComE-like DNA-binding protein
MIITLVIFPLTADSCLLTKSSDFLINIMLILTDQEKKVAVFALVVIGAGASLQLAFKVCPLVMGAVAVIDNPAFYPKVNVNTASLEELVTVPHIGPSCAQRIVATRPFRDLNDLERAGIGAGTLHRVGKYLVVR